MLFTALTTTACYGTPAPLTMPGPTPLPAGLERSLRQIPKTVGKAYVFVQKADGSRAERTFEATARLTEEGVLLLSGGTPDKAELLKLTARVSAQHLPQGEAPGEALDLAHEVFQAETRFEGAVSDGSLVIGQGADSAAKPPVGSLTLTARGTNWLAGMLRLEAQGDMLEVYFRLKT